jgi:hypothetical protein
MSDPYAGIATVDPYHGIGVADSAPSAAPKAAPNYSNISQAAAVKQLQEGRDKLAKLTEGYTPAEKAKAQSRYDANPAIQQLRQAAGKLSDYSLSDLATSKLTMGITDKIKPLVQAGVDYATGKPGNFSDNYQRHQSEIDKAKADYQDAHPIADWATFPLNFAGGGVSLAKGIGKVTLGALAKQGALAGGVAGIGSARGDAVQQAEQVAGSAAGGAVLAPAVGAAAPIVLSAAKRVSAPVVNALSAAAGKAPSAPVTNSGKVLLQTLADQGQTPMQAGKAIEAAHANGVPMAIMDTGESTQGLAAAIGRKPGPAQKLIREVVVPRQTGATPDGSPSLVGGQAERVQEAIKRNLGPVANVRAASEDIIKGAQEKAAPLYEKAYSSPVVSTQELDSLLSTPFGRQALSRAKTIAANERRDPMGLGFSNDADGNVVLNPVPIAHLDRMDSARIGWEKANSSYDAAVAKRQASLMPGLHSQEVASAEKNLKSANIELDAAKEAFSAVPKSGSVQDKIGYSTQTLDYVKRGMDDIIESQRDPVTRRLHLDEDGRAKNDVLRKMLREIDKFNPTYAEARSAYAGPAKMATALNKGSKIGTKDAETIWAETRDLTQPELDQYKLGVRSALSKLIEGKTDGADKINALLNTPKKRKALVQLFGGEKGLDRFFQTLSQEGQLAKTYGRVNTGSITAANLADDANLGGIGSVAANAGVRAIKGHGIVGNTVATLSDLVKYGSGEAGKRTVAELAAGLSETDPAALRQVLKSAARAAAYKRAMASNNGSSAKASVLASGRTAGTLAALLGPDK